MRGVLRPALAGRASSLQRRSGEGWQTVDRTATTRGGRFVLRWRPGRPGSAQLRVRFAATRIRATRRIVGRLNVYRRALASWYGPGLYGNALGCGGRAVAGHDRRRPQDAAVRHEADAAPPGQRSVRVRVDRPRARTSATASSTSPPPPRHAWASAARARCSSPGSRPQDHEGHVALEPDPPPSAAGAPPRGVPSKRVAPHRPPRHRRVLRVRRAAAPARAARPAGHRRRVTGRGRSSRPRPTRRGSSASARRCRPSRARRLCPDAILIPPDFTAYRAVSQKVMALVRGQVDRVEVVGLDEAYLDLSGLVAPRAAMRRLVARDPRGDRPDRVGRDRPEQARGQGGLRRREARRLRRAHAARRRARASPRASPGARARDRAEDRRAPRGDGHHDARRRSRRVGDDVLAEHFGGDQGPWLRRRARFDGSTHR